MVVQCGVCPKMCVIAPGESGECRIRVNLDGRLLAVTYGFPCSIHLDPIEKKPLFHFLPGTSILSLATVGCNLHCLNCQNWEISQQNPEDSAAYPLAPADLVRAARSEGCPAIAYTYTDPVAYFEYARDCSIQARAQGLKNVLVTAGYCNPGPWQELCRHADAANIDLKAFSDTFYRDVCDGTLQPVLDALVAAKSAGVWVEVTNLVIPTLNDQDRDFERLSHWHHANLGADTPLHFSRFHPQFKMRHLPPTPPETLDRARAIAQAAGLHYVYIGNVLRPDGENTVCPTCRLLLVERRGFAILQNVVRDGRCPRCNHAIAGVWA